MPPRNSRSGTAVRQAWPRQGSEFIAQAGQGLATLARRRKRWQRKVYWVKNIQMILFTAINILNPYVSFPARRPRWNSFKLSMIYGGMGTNHRGLLRLGAGCRAGREKTGWRAGGAQRDLLRLEDRLNPARTPCFAIGGAAGAPLLPAPRPFRCRRSVRRIGGVKQYPSSRRFRWPTMGFAAHHPSYGQHGRLRSRRRPSKITAPRGHSRFGPGIRGRARASPDRTPYRAPSAGSPDCRACRCARMPSRSPRSGGRGHGRPRRDRSSRRCRWSRTRTARRARGRLSACRRTPAFPSRTNRATPAPALAPPCAPRA